MGLPEQFDELFAGRRDVWGGVHGECIKRPLELAHFYDHLHGDLSVGVYPLVDGQVHWGCTDIDLGFDKIVLARNLYKALHALGIVSWVEKTKGKGFHVWVFVNDWVPALTMRNALLVAHQLAGVPPIEVNPKQVEGTYGNYVNLPYAKSCTTGRFVFDHRYIGLDYTPLPADLFVQRALDTRNSPEAIEAAANLYVPPPPPRAVRIERYDGGMDGAVRKLSGLAFTIFNDGPLEGRDRSRTLARLAHFCYECGLTPGEAMEVVADADRRWGKYSERPDCYQQLTKMIEGAYG